MSAARYDGGKCSLNQLAPVSRPELADACGFANLLMDIGAATTVATLDTDPDQVARPGTVDAANVKIG